jgi:pyrophosphatase PpaX
MRFATVLFDLDGTVIDSGAMILASMRHATSSVLARDFPDDQLLANVGSSVLHEQMRRFDPDRVDDLVRAYREHNEPLHTELQACSGMIDVLDRLRGEGRRLGIVTSKRHATVRMAFDVCPLERFFATVVAAEDTARHKPDPAPIRLALEQLDSQAEDAAYVGDAPFDVAAARAAGVFAMAVGWGGIHSRARVETERPDAYVESPEELLGIL